MVKNMEKEYTITITVINIRGILLMMKYMEKELFIMQMVELIQDIGNMAHIKVTDVHNDVKQM